VKPFRRFTALPVLPAGRSSSGSLETKTMRTVFAVLACLAGLMFAPFIDFLPPPGGKGE
jgi:hypothetical protein